MDPRRWKASDGTPYPYKGSGTHDVETGDLWSVGPHLFACSDTVLGDLLPRVLAENPPDMVYADPPWTDGQARQFRTLGGMPEPEYEWTNVYRRTVELARKYDAAMWLVTDVPNAQAVRDLVPEASEKVWRLDGLSTPKVKALLHYAGPEREHGADFTDVIDHKLPGLIMGTYQEAGTILDPVSGLGLTSRCAHKAGWRCISNELNPVRVSAALFRTAKLVGVEPKLLERA